MESFLDILHPSQNFPMSPGIFQPENEEPKDVNLLKDLDDDMNADVPRKVASSASVVSEASVAATWQRWGPCRNESSHDMVSDASSPGTSSVVSSTGLSQASRTKPKAKKKTNGTIALEPDRVGIFKDEAPAVPDRDGKDSDETPPVPERDGKVSDEAPPVPERDLTFMDEVDIDPLPACSLEEKVEQLVVHVEVEDMAHPCLAESHLAPVFHLEYTGLLYLGTGPSIHLITMPRTSDITIGFIRHTTLCSLTTTLILHSKFQICRSDLSLRPPARRSHERTSMTFRSSQQSRRSTTSLADDAFTTNWLKLHRRDSFGQ
ncbi:unnamed protein product [Cladocopium goreaui]|uniref:Uncharacterized protein n=1 Tax=Cladocopium goreaui TaxID=2562237 RepID=A0A9P1DV48_9DINO|nr:unnamed protein product [Cladocopium goreaui]